jgi:hypothetical protein
MKNRKYKIKPLNENEFKSLVEKSFYLENIFVFRGQNKRIFSISFHKVIGKFLLAGFIYIV